jgi:hypothetical protein
LIRPPAGSTQCSSVGERANASSLCRHQALDPAKSKQLQENANGGIGGAACNENHTSGDAAQPCALRHGATIVQPQYGTTSSGFRSRELHLHVSMARSPRKTNFFALLSQDCIPCAGWPDKSLCHSRTPSEDRHAMHTILPRLEKEKDVEPSWESCSFSLSRFAIRDSISGKGRIEM